MDVDMDNFWGIGYLVDDESFEAEKVFKTFDSHGVMLEKAWCPVPLTNIALRFWEFCEK